MQYFWLFLIINIYNTLCPAAATLRGILLCASAVHDDVLMWKWLCENEIISIKVCAKNRIHESGSEKWFLRENAISSLPLKVSSVDDYTPPPQKQNNYIIRWMQERGTATHLKR